MLASIEKIHPRIWSIIGPLIATLIAAGIIAILGFMSSFPFLLILIGVIFSSLLTFFITFGALIYYKTKRMSLVYLSRAKESKCFLDACKECESGIFLNVKIDFNNWFTPVLQSHLAYQDVAVRFKQLRALKNMDTTGKAFPFADDTSSYSLGSPLKRILFLTSSEEQKALTAGSGKLESERCALERCHWAMGIPLSFVTATRLIRLFSGDFKHEGEIHQLILAYRKKVTSKRYLWELLGFEWELFKLFEKMLDCEATPEDRERARKLFDQSLSGMRRDSASVGKDRVIGTIDCAVLRFNSSHSLWGAAFVKDKRHDVCCYYNLNEESLRELQKKCDLYANGNRFEIDGNREKIDQYKEALTEFSNLAEQLSFVPVNSVIHNGQLPTKVEEQSDINPAIQVWMEHLKEQESLEEPLGRPLRIFHDDFVYVERNH